MIGPVCQAQYPHIQDTAKQILIQSSSRPQAWATWARLSGNSLRSAGKLELEHFYLCIQAALSGQGMTIVSRLMVEDELQSGQLIAPQGFIPDGSAYYLLSPQALDQNPRAEVFASWLSEQLESQKTNPHQ
jgi:DNA-binding transcriptional LysR family regulator